MKVVYGKCSIPVSVHGSKTLLALMYFCIPIKLEKSTVLQKTYFQLFQDHSLLHDYLGGVADDENLLATGESKPSSPLLLPSVLDPTAS